MVKVSITLPNNAQITFEAQEPEVMHQVVEMALRDLPRELMLAVPPVNGSLTEPASSEKGSPEKGSNVIAANPSRAKVTPDELMQVSQPPLGGGPDSSPKAAEQAFMEFCQSANPLGDMRRVVVAIEGASRFLNLDSVDTQDLDRLFDLAGWRHPPNFVQTLRNAARSKFRWLERIPGRSGRYSVTDLGRSTTLGG